jgi:hypothetical protein
LEKRFNSKKRGSDSNHCYRHPNKLDAVIKEIESEILLDFMHTFEHLMGRKPVLRLATSAQSAFLDYLFGD